MKKHKIEDVELLKGGYNRGDSLSYVADGELVSVSGEFFVDETGLLHHTHEFPDGTEVEIATPYN